MTKQAAIIDTDPGIDDALALVAALYNDDLDVKLISTVPGNVNVNLTTRNALQLVDFLEVDLPVARGAAQPLLVELEDASKYHGETGLDGFEFKEISNQAIETPSIQAMAETILENEEPTTIFALGPLTNIALLISSYPQVKEKINQVIIMGGSLAEGNTTTAAEFNFYSDPHAAAIVFKSGLDLYMFGLHVTNQARIRQQSIQQLKEKGELGQMLHAVLSHYRGGSFERGLNMHDSCTVAYFEDPDLFTMEKMQVEIITEGFSRGASVVDLQKESDQWNVQVATAVDSEKFEDWLLASIDRAQVAMEK